MAFLLSRNQVNKITNRYIKIQSFPSSSLPFTTPSENLCTVLEEQDVLDQLSQLLPIRKSATVVEPSQRQDVEKKKCIASYLTPEEKLRGVFLQKLNGKSFAERALLNAGVDLSQDILSGVLNEGGMGGDAMLTFFNWAIKQPGIQDISCSYNALLRALGKRKYVNFIEKAVHQMKCEGVKLNLEGWVVVMDGLVRGQRVKKAIEIFEKCEEFGLEWGTDSLNVLLKCLCETCHVGVANSYLNSVKKKLEFDAMSYNIVIGGWAKVGRTAKIDILIEEMAEDGFRPDCLTFAHLIEGLWRAGKVEESVKMFDSMKESCLPNIGVYNVMIRNFISVGKLDVAINYFERLSSAQCNPDASTYEYLIIALIRARKVSDALAMFDGMMGKGIFLPTRTITRCIELLCSFGPPFGAMTIYSNTRKTGCKISLSAYKSLLLRLSRFGKCGMMSKLWKNMTEDGYSDDVETYECIISGLSNVGHLEAAISVMETALENGFCPNKIVYSKLNNKLIKTNNVERAYRLYLKVKKARRDEGARRYWRANGWHF